MQISTATGILTNLGYEIYDTDGDEVTFYNQKLARSIKIVGTEVSTMKDGSENDPHTLVCNLFGIKHWPFIAKIKALK